MNGTEGSASSASPATNPQVQFYKKENSNNGASQRDNFQSRTISDNSNSPATSPKSQVVTQNMPVRNNSQPNKSINSPHTINKPNDRQTQPAPLNPTQQRPVPQNSIFTPQQSELLRAQISALKSLVNNQPVPQEYQKVIQQSINNPPDFKRMLLSLSDFVKKKQLNQQSGSPASEIPEPQPHPEPQPQAQPPVQPKVQPPTEPQMQPQATPQAQSQPHAQSQQQDINSTSDNAKIDTNTASVNTSMTEEKPIIKTGTNTPNVTQEQIPPVGVQGTSSNTLREETHKTDTPSPRTIPGSVTHQIATPNLNKQENQNPETQNQYALKPPTERVPDPLVDGELKPAQQLPPVPIQKFVEKYPYVKNVVSIEDPDLMVDTFSIPTIPEEPVDYYSLFPNTANPKLVMEPGMLPAGVDIHTATDIYQTLIALNLDTSVNECISDMLDDSKDEKTKEETLYDYFALQFLPLQKAVRGHVLQYEWYQNSLLTNAHPNFLSKIRNINFNDVLLTIELYRKREVIRQEEESKRYQQKLTRIRNSVVNTFNHKVHRRNKRIKLGHKLVATHANIEKEEQKRAERKAKERLQALKANDEEAYIKLLDQTKDTRITHLLKQTNAFLDSLTKAVKDQQKYTKDMLNQHLMEKKEESAEPVVYNDDQMLTMSMNDDDDDEENIDYYNVAHRIKEEVRQQPSILVGGTLKEYQIKGLQWMVSLFNNHLNGILADEMGLGKTIQTISLLTYLYEMKNIKGPFLIIVPLSTLPNWSSEFAKWAPKLRTISYKGSPNERKMKQAQIKSGEFDAVITTFEYIIKERAILSKVKWVHMIIDEGHRMKNAQSKLSLTLNTFYHSDYRLILTGTPLQNNLPELWALLNFVLPKIFNSAKSFDEWFNTPFANTGGQDKIELSEEETLLIIRRLHKVLRPFLLRRLKKDVEKELPDKVEKVIKCKMSALQHAMYQQMLKHKQLFIGDQKKNKLVGLRGFNNQLMQLKKICNHPFVFEEVEDHINPTRDTNMNIWRVAGKFELLERILPKLKASRHRVLIFFQMTQIMDIMEDFLRYIDIKYLRLDGHTRSDERGELLKLFNDPNSEYFCFILSTRAGGLGLNLQTADTVIIFDTDWNPHQDLQAQDRAHRIGQKNEVRIIRLITTNSVEEVILERAYKKLDIDGKVIQAGKFDNKSTAEEQEALLRSLLEAEEGRRRRREAGIEEEEELRDNEINEILARSEDDLALFSKLDTEREEADKAMHINSRLMTLDELPEIYHRNIDEELKKEESESAETYGRGTRERKQMIYSDNMSEEQWLKQFEVSDSEDKDPNKIMELKDDETDVNSNAIKTESNEAIRSSSMSIPSSPTQTMNNTPETNDLDSDSGENAKKRKAPSTRPRGRPKKIKTDDGENNPIESITGDVGDSTEDVVKRAGKTSIKSANTSSRGRGRGRGRGKPRGRAGMRGRGRPPKSKNGMVYVRMLPEDPVSEEERKGIAEQATKLYDFALNYVNSDERRLSDIFLVKPSKHLYPDYYLIIKYPIAFDTIKDAIDRLQYNSITEVMEDFHLMFANARVYNTEGSIIYEDAIELEDAMLQKYVEITKDTATLDFTEFDAKYGTKPLHIQEPETHSTNENTPQDSSKDII